MISKKDLLKEMNISYGQLYRWKREGIIPDEWFIKQSVPSGQETFFDEELIIPRIQKIKNLKDSHSLEDLKEFLNPDINKRIFSSREIILIEDFDPYVIKTYLQKNKELRIVDLAIIYIFSKHPELRMEEYLDYNFSENVTVNSVFYIIMVNERHYILVINEKGLIDKKIEIKEKIRIEDVVEKIIKEL